MHLLGRLRDVCDGHGNRLQKLDRPGASRGALEELHAEVQHIPGFDARYVIRTGEQTLVMVTLYASEQVAGAVSAQARTHLGQLIGPHVSGPPRRMAGEIVLPREKA